MTAHTIHPNSHAYGLADDCPRCLEHAREPFDSLDDVNLRRLIDRVELNLPPRSINEMIAMGRVRELLAIAERIGILKSGAIL